MIIKENTNRIPYDLVSSFVILRDWVDVDNAYVNNEHKMLVDIADSLYNAGISIDEMQDKYKTLYNKYGEDYFDTVIEDAQAIDSQLTHNNIEDFIADMNDRLDNFV
jgi:hypothetical protein